MREDFYTNTPEDAGRYERARADADYDPDVPTLADVEADEACCPNAWVAARRFCGCGGAA